MSSSQELVRSLVSQRVKLVLNQSRQVEGTVGGYDKFSNIVLEDAVDLATRQPLGTVMVRGNAIVSAERAAAAADSTRGAQ